jgi:hypothetical protein
MSAGPRTHAERCRDTEHRLTHDVDVWVASASVGGARRTWWLRVVPRRIQAWREENELAGREVMREGRWLV